MTVNQVCRKCLTCLPTDTRPDPAVASPTLVIVIPRSCLCRSAGTVAGSASEPSSLVTPHHTYTRTGRQSAEMKCISGVTATPWMAILSIYIDLLSLRSFRRSEIKTFVGCCARAPKDENTAAHLFDARCTLLSHPHRCRGPQCWGIGHAHDAKGRSGRAAIAGNRPDGSDRTKTTIF